MGTRIDDDEDEKVAYESNPKEQYENVFGLGSQWIVKPTLIRCKLCNLTLMISSISSHIERKHPECLHNKHPDEMLVSSYTGGKFKAKTIVIHSTLTDHQKRRKSRGDKQSQLKSKVLQSHKIMLRSPKNENKRRISTSDDDYYAKKKKKAKRVKTRSRISRNSSSKKSLKLKIPKPLEDEEELFVYSDTASMNMEEEVIEPIHHTQSLEELVVLCSSENKSIPDKNEMSNNVTNPIFDLSSLDKTWKNKEHSPKHNGFSFLFQKTFLNGSSCRFSNHSPEILPKSVHKYCLEDGTFTNKCRNLYKMLCDKNPKLPQSYVSSILFRNRFRRSQSPINEIQTNVINRQPSDVTLHKRNLETLNDACMDDKMIENEKNIPNLTQSNVSHDLFPNMNQITVESFRSEKRIKVEPISQSPVEHFSKSSNGTGASIPASQTSEMSKKLLPNTSSSVVCSLQNNIIVPLQLKRVQIMANKSNQVFTIRPPNPLNIPEIIRKPSIPETQTHTVSKPSKTSFRPTLRVPQSSEFGPNPALGKSLINQLASVGCPRKIQAHLTTTNETTSSLKPENSSKIGNGPFKQNGMIVGGVPINNNFSKDPPDTTKSGNNQNILIPIHLYDNNSNSNGGNLKTANNHSHLTPNQSATTSFPNSKSNDGHSREPSVAVINRNHQSQSNSVVIQNAQNRTTAPLQPMGSVSKTTGINSLGLSSKPLESLVSSNDSYMSMGNVGSTQKNFPIADQQQRFHQTPVSLVCGNYQMNVNNHPSTSYQSVVRISLSQKDMELLKASRLEVIAHTSANNTSPLNDNNNLQSATQSRYFAAGSIHQNNIIRRPMPSSLFQNISVNQTNTPSQHLMKLIPHSVNAGSGQHFGSNFTQNPSPTTLVGTNKEANLIPFYIRTSKASGTRDSSSLPSSSDGTAISFQNIQQNVCPLNLNFTATQHSQPQLSQFSSSSSSSLGKIQSSAMGFSGTNVIHSNMSKHPSDSSLNVSRAQVLSKNAMKTLLLHRYPQQQEQEQVQMNQKSSTHTKSTTLPLFLFQGLQPDQILPQVVASRYSHNDLQVSNYRLRNDQFAEISRPFNSNQLAASVTSSTRPQIMPVASYGGNNSLNTLKMPFHQNFQRQQTNQSKSPNLNRSSNPANTQNVIRIGRNLQK